MIRYDLYEHEPLPLLAVAVACGALAMATAGRVEDYVLSIWSRAGSLGVAAVAALTEEAAKLAVVLLVSILARREFDDPMDGVVYGSMAGLGASLEESVFYQRSTALAAFVPAAELVRLWAHVVLGGIAAFPLGFWRARPPRAALFALVSLGGAVALHFTWDAVVLSAREGEPLGSGPTLLGIGLMVFALALYGRLVVAASARSRQVFAPGSTLRLWGWPFDRLAR